MEIRENGSGKNLYGNVLRMLKKQFRTSVFSVQERGICRNHGSIRFRQDYPAQLYFHHWYRQCGTYLYGRNRCDGNQRKKQIARFRRENLGICISAMGDFNLLDTLTIRKTLPWHWLSTRFLQVRLGVGAGNSGKLNITDILDKYP